MPALIAALGGMFITIMGTLVGRVLLALGLSYVTYSGFDIAVGSLLTGIKSNMSGMGVEVVNLLGWFWVDKAIGMVFSAFSAALAIKMAGGSTLTKLVRK